MMEAQRSLMNLLAIGVDASFVAESDRLFLSSGVYFYYLFAALAVQSKSAYIYYVITHKAPGGVSSTRSGTPLHIP